MKRNKEQIIRDINALLQELGSTAETTSPLVHNMGTLKNSTKKGCVGALQSLIEEGFFSELKKLEEVLTKLEEEGEPYSRALVSMNLLNLVKRKVLRRIKREDKWQYVIRK